MTRTLQSRRFALISCVVVLGLSACGSRNVATSAQKPAVIHLGAQPAGGDTRSAGAPTSADATFADAESKIAAPSSITYVYNGEVTDLTAPAGSWYFGPGESPSRDVIQALASALGISGEATDVPADQGGGWMVGSSDYTKPNLTVSSDAMHSWWYNPGYTETLPVAPCETIGGTGEVQVDRLIEPATEPAVAPAVESTLETAASEVAPVDPSQTFANPCGVSEPPANVPTKEQAEAKAREFFSSIGVNLDNMVFETYADEWGANVTGYLVLDGIRTTVSVSVGYGAEGATTWSSGYLATPQRGGDYPRVGIDEAITRLNEQATWMYASARGGVAVDVVADPAGTEPVSPESASSSIEVAPEGSADEAPLECGPAVDCVAVDPQPITIELSNARATLEQIWAADGTIWLVPGYGFDSADQGIYSVIAIDDSFIDVDQPIAIDAPIEAPLPEPLPLPNDPAVSAPAVDCPAVEIPTGNTASVPGSDAADAWVGMCLADAQQYADNVGYILRIVRQDGVDLPATADFITNRFNVAVENGIITEVLSQG